MKLLIGLFLSLLIVASASSENSKTLLIGNSGEPATLDSHKYNLRLEETLLKDLFLGLTTFNAKGEIVPGAVKSWETSDGGLTWRFFLRNELKWSDGENLAAEDFVYSFRRLLNPHTAASLSYFLYMIKNAELVNNAEKASSSLGVYGPGRFNEGYSFTPRHPQCHKSCDQLWNHNSARNHIGGKLHQFLGTRHPRTSNEPGRTDIRWSTRYGD